MEKILRKIIWAFIIAPVVYLGIVWSTIPETVPLHFKLNGEVDRYGSKNELVLMTLVLTAVSIIVYLLLPQVYRIDPNRHAAENKSRLYRLAFCISVFVAAVSGLLIYSTIKANIEFGTRFIMAGAGILIAIAGNYIYTIKPNYFAGIRLPWTLSSDENWRRTHLLAGKLFFAGGLIVAVISLFTSVKVSIIILFIVMLVVAIVVGVYSYRLYKRLQTGA
jgi:uncharacterized membrane protein